MAAVDPNILIGTLVILSVLAYIFMLRRMRTKQTNSSDAAVSAKPGEGATLDSKEIAKPRQPIRSPKKKLLTECDYHFGYLSSLSRKSDIPKECLDCRKRTKCVDRKKPRKANDRRIEAVLAADEETADLKQ